MNFKLRFDKLLAATGVLFREENRDRMNYMRLLKLLYFAEREFLRVSGRPIVGGRVIAMERGPVLEEVYDLIRDQHVDLQRWSSFFVREHYDLRMLKNPGVQSLSRKEIEVLQGVARAHEDKDEWMVVEEAHQLEEWKTHAPGKSSRPIPLEDILKAVGRGKDAKAILREAEEDTVLEELLSQPPPRVRAKANT